MVQLIQHADVGEDLARTGQMCLSRWIACGEMPADLVVRPALLAGHRQSLGRDQALAPGRQGHRLKYTSATEAYLSKICTAPGWACPIRRAARPAARRACSSSWRRRQANARTPSLRISSARAPRPASSWVALLQSWHSGIAPALGQ